MTYDYLTQKVLATREATERVEFTPMELEDAKAQFESDEAAAAFIVETQQWLSGLTDKVTDAEVDDDLAAAAILWATEGEGASDDFAFTVEIRNKLTNGKRVTVGQIRGLLNVMRAKENFKARQQEREEHALAFRATFPVLVKKMNESGYEKPVVRLVTETGREIKITRAPMRGRNPGWFYVAGAGDAYYGKISPEAEADTKLDDTFEDVLAALAAFEGDPEEMIARYGRETGNCGICGRTLSNEISIERGIGPVCADKYGLD